ncbi:MAG: hypothetical protein FWH55_05300 [Oscillospiraceae bacterium]|nr:hypothetical protein [Oscillospiraceae bacterium]
MEINEITKTFGYSISIILHAKLRNFIKKSVWVYLLASLLFANALDGVFMAPFVGRFLIVFGGLLLLSISSMLISSRLIYLKKRKDNADITFKEDQIIVYWKYSGETEIKTWDWIKSFEEVNDIYYLDLDVWPKNVVIISKQKLTNDESIVLHEWLYKNNKIKT